MRWIEHYKQLAETDVHNGTDIINYVTPIKALIQERRCNTLLDFGCGGGYQYYVHEFHKKIGMNFRNVELYDPAFEAYNIPLKKTYDIVTCVNVLNCVPPEDLDKTIDLMLSLARKAVFFTVKAETYDVFENFISKDYAKSVLGHPFKRNKGLKVVLQIDKRKY